MLCPCKVSSRRALDGRARVGREKLYPLSITEYSDALSGSAGVPVAVAWASRPSKYVGKPALTVRLRSPSLSEVEGMPTPQPAGCRRYDAVGLSILQFLGSDLPRRRA